MSSTTNPEPTRHGQAARGSGFAGRSGTRRLLSAGGTALGLVAALAGILFLFFQWRFYPSPEVRQWPPPQSRAEAMRQDLQVLAQLPDLDRSFTDATRARFEQERQRLLAEADLLTPEAFEMQVSRLVALAGNGHTTVGRRILRLPRVGLRVAWFDEGLFIVRATAEHADLLGAQVLRINGRSPEELLAGVAPYLSGTPEWVRANSPLFLESPAALSGIWPGMDHATLQLVARTADGRSLDATLSASAHDPALPRFDPARSLAPQPIPGEGAGDRRVLDGATALPLVLRDPDASVLTQPLDDGAGLYIHLKQVEGDTRGSLRAQLDRVLSELAPGALRYAILDLRLNTGGDYTQTLSFTKNLPQRIAADGRLYLLTDNSTFSAAIVTLARAKHFAGERAQVLGEPAGDGGRFWAEGGPPIELPNSKIPVFFATGYHDWSRGCQRSDLARCFWINLVAGVPAGELHPAQPLRWRFADYRAGVDTVLEEALRRERATRREEELL